MRPIWIYLLSLLFRFSYPEAFSAGLYAIPGPIPEVGESSVKKPAPQNLLTAAKRAGIELNHLRSNALRQDGPAALDAFADTALFHKGVIWALRYETNLTDKDIGLVTDALRRGQDRLEASLRGQTQWQARKGKLLRGYISVVDGSTQPYGLIIPQNYTGKESMRLDVVLHGSSKPVGLSELRFGVQFDEDDTTQGAARSQHFIELHPLGRVENCYRWAGETDVFEAIEAVCRSYNIDRKRIVLRGMSMGASGAWHLGLKHPDYFVAIGPYCGYVDTHRFSETPISNFVKVGALPPFQERTLHMLDSVDYAANAGIVPSIAAIGDHDVFFQAHVLMGEAMAREGLTMVNLISLGTGHVIDPPTHQEQMARIKEFADKGIDERPKHLRFVTWTLKYNRCHWIELLGLEEHYRRAEIEARIAEDGSIKMKEPKNITRFTIASDVLEAAHGQLSIDGKSIHLPECRNGHVFSKRRGEWTCDPLNDFLSNRKRPGLQGPIDDAFAAAFLCVRGTGKPWNPAVCRWTEANLRRFQYEWARYMRGDLPVKNDTEVTGADLREKNLILFGDPGSNSWIAKALPNLPCKWMSGTVTLGKESYSAKDHVPVLICPNPLSDGNRYLVLNSGHSFHEKEFAALNYLLYPRLGDWAVLRVSPGAPDWQPGNLDFPEEVIQAGLFDEQWSKPLLIPD